MKFYPYNLLPLVAITMSLLIALPTSAQLTVNVDLGTLAVESTTPLEGDTSLDAEGSEVQAYDGLGLVVTDTQAVLYGNEVVYEFDIATPFVFEGTRNEGDAGLILLDSLDIGALATGHTVATGGRGRLIFGSNPSTSIGGVFEPGTYYLSATTQQGLGLPSLAPVPGGAFDIDLTLAALPTASDIDAIAVDLGVIANNTDPITLDSFGSSIGDTEIGLFDSSGNLLATNDDGGDGVTTPQFQSRLSLADGLNSGTYYVAIGSFDTVFDDSFFAASGSGGGDVVLNYQQGLSADSTVVAGSRDSAFFTFRVVPEPTSLALLGMAASCFLVRRK